MTKKPIFWISVISILIVLSIAIIIVIYFSLKDTDPQRANWYIIKGIIVIGILGYKLYGWIKDKSIIEVSLAEPMLEDEFWDVIEKSLNRSSNQDEQLQYIEGLLNNFSKEKLYAFDQRLHSLLTESYRQDLRCAAFLLKDGCSDDSFEYFRCWLILRGKIVYKSALTNPDSLVDHVHTGLDEDYECEELFLIASSILEDKFGIAVDRSQIGSSKEIEFEWSEDDNDSMKKVCPRIYHYVDKRIFTISAKDFEEMFIQMWSHLLKYYTIKPMGNLMFEIETINGAAKISIDLSKEYQKTRKSQKHIYEMMRTKMLQAAKELN